MRQQHPTESPADPPAKSTGSPRQKNLTEYQGTETNISQINFTTFIIVFTTKI